MHRYFPVNDQMWQRNYQLKKLFYWVLSKNQQLLKILKLYGLSTIKIKSEQFDNN